MTMTSMHVIAGRPIQDCMDAGEDYICKILGIEESVDLASIGLHCLYQGNAYFGVRAKGVWSPSANPILASSLSLTVSDKIMSKARTICDEQPESLKSHPKLLPFGVWLVSSDG